MEYLILYCIYVVSVLISVFLCFKILAWLRFVFPIYVNCWFCNQNYWIRLVQWNSWSCPGCEQYNGFDSDGNYNKPVIQYGTSSSKDSRRSLKPPRNGLCRICNINQHLKVTQLTNFIPTNEKKFDVEIEAYRSQLEKAYKLCTPCHKFVKAKLRKDKEKILGINLRLSKSFYSVEKPQSSIFSRMIAAFLLVAACLFLLLTICELHRVIDYENMAKFTNDFYKKANDVLVNFLDQHTDFLNGLSSTLPFSLRINEFEWKNFMNNVSFPNIEIPAVYAIETEQITIAEKVVGGIGSVLQLFLNLWTLKALSNGTILSLLWAIVLSSSFVNTAGNIVIVVKFLAALLLVVLYKKSEYLKTPKKASVKSPMKTKKAKATIQQTNGGYCSSEESGDDVSLRKFGIESSPNSSRSLNESFSNMAPSVYSSNGFKVPNAWTHSNSVLSHPSLGSFSVYQYPSSRTAMPVPNKPSFNEYQTHNSDHSDLDEGLGGLTLGTERKGSKRPGVFSLRKYNSLNSSMFRPVFTPRGRHLISPSRLSHGTQQSWVAGGYWGGEPTHNIFNTMGLSRSSSQSSGFESQSSIPANNLFVNSPPPSREDSECGDFDKTSVFNEPNDWNRASQFAPHYNVGAMSRMAIHPLMNYSDHVHLPNLGNSRPHLFSTFDQNEFCVQPCNAQRKGSIFPLSDFGHNQQSNLIRIPQNS